MDVSPICWHFHNMLSSTIRTFMHCGFCFFPKIHIWRCSQIKKINIFYIYNIIFIVKVFKWILELYSIWILILCKYTKEDGLTYSFSSTQRPVSSRTLPRTWPSVNVLHSLFHLLHHKTKQARWENCNYGIQLEQLEPSIFLFQKRVKDIP